MLSLMLNKGGNMVSKVFHAVTAGLYKNFSNQSGSQQITRIALPLILGVGLIYALVRYSTNWLGHSPTNNKQTPPKDKTEPNNAAPTSTGSAVEKASLSSTFLSKLIPTEEEYTKNLASIPGQAIPSTAQIDSEKETSEFFDLAKDGNGDIRLWSNDKPRKLQKDGFMELSQKWISRGGKVFHPQKGKPVVVDSNALCSPWCHEGKNRSALVCDFLMRTGHHDTLLPEGAKDGYLFPDLDVDSDAEDARYPVIRETTGFQAGRVVRIGDKFTERQEGFTELFNEFATLDKPVMIFAFVSAVPLLMREIMKRTDDKSLSNITLVAFHHSDPMADVPNPTKRENVNAFANWVVKHNLQEKLEQAQALYDRWKAAGNNASVRTPIFNELAPLEQELFFYSRKDAAEQFQTELAQLICVSQ